MLRGELTLTLRFLWFGSTAGLSSGLLTEGRSVTSDLVLMNPRSPAHRRHTSTFTPVNEKQRFSVSRCSAERQLKVIAQNYRILLPARLLEQRDKVFPQDSSFHPQSHPPHLSPRHRCILNKLKPDVSVCPSENHPIVTKKKKHGAE